MATSRVFADDEIHLQLSLDTMKLQAVGLILYMGGVGEGLVEILAYFVLYSSSI